jgi:Asp-tRNA(Asn)/Glu-tRNA(Gln) amidotransferase B subunit
MSLHLAKPEHEAAYQDLCQLVNRHASKLTSLELLAVAANMLGKLIALQDQRTISPSQAMEIVAQNIEHGNKQVLDELGKSRGTG